MNVITGIIKVSDSQLASGKPFSVIKIQVKINIQVKSDFIIFNALKVLNPSFLVPLIIPNTPSKQIERVRAKYCSQLDKDKFHTYEIRKDIVNNGIDSFKKIVDFMFLAN
jgi:hypothetical protein